MAPKIRIQKVLLNLCTSTNKIQFFSRAGDINNMWAIPAKNNESDGMDPWTRAQKEKKERVEKNLKKHKRNLQAAVGDRLPGTFTSNPSISCDFQVQTSGTIDLGTAIPTKKNKKNKKPKHHIDVRRSQSLILSSLIHCCRLLWTWPRSPRRPWESSTN